MKSTKYGPNVNIKGLLHRNPKPAPNVIDGSTVMLSPTTTNNVANGDTYPPSTTTAGQDEEAGHGKAEEDEEVEVPTMSLPLTIGLLVVITVASLLFLACTMRTKLSADRCRNCRVPRRLDRWSHRQRSHFQRVCRCHPPSHCWQRSR